MHALLFGVYSNAVVSMTDDACLEILEEDRWTLVSRYTAGAQYALHKSGFLQSSDLTVLQALVLYLVCPRTPCYGKVRYEILTALSTQ